MTGGGTGGACGSDGTAACGGASFERLILGTPPNCPSLVCLSFIVQSLRVTLGWLGPLLVGIPVDSSGVCLPGGGVAEVEAAGGVEGVLGGA